MTERREPERYAELILLLDGVAAARSILEGLLEESDGTVDAGEVETALEQLRTIGRVAPGGAVVGGRGRPFEALGPADAQADMQEFRAGSVVVDYSGAERDDLDRVVGANLLIELEDPDEPGFELVRFEESDELAEYHSDWEIATVPGCEGVVARLDLEFSRPRRLSLRLLFDVTSHRWALSAMELNGGCVITVRTRDRERRVRVRAPRSAQLTTALMVVRMLDRIVTAYEESPVSSDTIEALERIPGESIPPES